MKEEDISWLCLSQNRFTQPSHDGLHPFLVNGGQVPGLSMIQTAKMMGPRNDLETSVVSAHQYHTN